MNRIQQTEITVNGWRYGFFSDGGRPFHFRIDMESGEQTLIDHTGNEGMSELTFASHVMLGFPPSPHNRPWRESEIQKAAFPVIFEKLEAVA